MKKFLILITMIFAFAAIFAVPAQSQIVTRQIAFGAKGVDSLYGAVTTYYYVNSAAPATGKTAATSKLENYYVYAIMAGTTRSAAPTPMMYLINLRLVCMHSDSMLNHKPIHIQLFS